MQGSFSEESLQLFTAMVSEHTGENYSESEDSYDFTRCVRPNGKAYGTSGKCKKGTEAAKPEQMAAPAPKRTKAERDTAARATLKRLAAKGPGTSVRKNGDVISVSKGSEFKAVLHPEQQSAIKKLKSGEKHDFEDEQGMWWSATRSGNSIGLAGGDRRFGNKPYKMVIDKSQLD